MLISLSSSSSSCCLCSLSLASRSAFRISPMHSRFLAADISCFILCLLAANSECINLLYYIIKTYLFNGKVGLIKNWLYYNRHRLILLASTAWTAIANFITSSALTKRTKLHNYHLPPEITHRHSTHAHHTIPNPSPINSKPQTIPPKQKQLANSSTTAMCAISGLSK